MRVAAILTAIGLICALVSILAGCGGGGAPAPIGKPAPGAVYEQLLMVQSGTEQVPGYNASGNFPTNMEPAESVAWQARAPGFVTLMLEPFKDTQFSRLDEYLAAAKAHPNITDVYVYDELFWASSGHAAIEIGSHEREITGAARRVQAAGFKSSVSIDADVILDPGFHLDDPQAFDVVWVVIYPSVYIIQPVPHDTHGCILEPAAEVNVLACAVHGLRAAGFTGTIGLVYQAFGIQPDGDPLTGKLAAQLEDDLRRQRVMIEAGPRLGVTRLAAFGFYPWDRLTAPLYPGKGSALESLMLWSPR